MLLTPLRHLSINIDRGLPKGKHASPNQFPDDRRFPGTNAPNLSEGRHVSADDAFNGSKLIEQSRRESWTNAWKPLEDEQPLRGVSLRLPVESTKDRMMRLCRLLGEQAQNEERVFRFRRMKHWKAPHRREGHDSSFDGMRMHIGHRWRCRPLDHQ